MNADNRWVNHYGNTDWFLSQMSGGAKKQSPGTKDREKSALTNAADKTAVIQKRVFQHNTWVTVTSEPQSPPSLPVKNSKYH